MKRDKILKLAKGYRGRAKNCKRIAILRVHKGLQHAYVDRKKKKRNFRSLWIQNVNAGAREHGLSYSTFVNGLNVANVELNRNVLANLAQTEPFSFRAVVEVVKRQQQLQQASATDHSSVSKQG